MNANTAPILATREAHERAGRVQEQLFQRCDRLRLGVRIEREHTRRGTTVYEVRVFPRGRFAGIYVFNNDLTEAVDQVLDELNRLENPS